MGYCSQACELAAKQQGMFPSPQPPPSLPPPQMTPPPQMGPPTPTPAAQMPIPPGSSSAQAPVGRPPPPPCPYPGCVKPCYVDPSSGHVHSFCGKKHAAMNSWPGTGQGQYHNKLHTYSISLIDDSDCSIGFSLGYANTIIINSSF